MAPSTPAPLLEPGVVAVILTGHVHPDPDQPRRSFDEKALESLADNIRERGVLQPILVRQDGARLLIVDGERRWRAAKRAELPIVPVLLTPPAESQQLRLDQLSVNELHERLKPMDLAHVLRGLRDAGKTTNDIAATLARQGHPAMKPAAIDQLAKLTDLPAWTQELVNDDRLEIKHAGELLGLLERPGLEKHVRKSIQQALSYAGQLLGHNVRHAGDQALAAAGGIDLDNIESWHSEPRVHFAWKTRCKGCEHLQRWAEGAFCMSKKRFEEHNQEAKDAGLLPGGRLPEKPKQANGKAAEKAANEKCEQREASLGEKARAYLHAYLCVALVQELPRRDSLQIALSIWRALKSPGSNGSRGASAVDAAIPASYRSIEQITGELSVDQLQKAAFDAALNVINELPWREVHALSRQLWGDDLHLVWNPEEPFLDLMRKAELAHLAQVHKIDLPEGRRSWDALKGAEIKAAFMAQREKWLRPALLADLYQSEIGPPYVPWHQCGDSDDLEDAA
jgi:ParB family chromosome partitioning protein